MVTLQNFPGGPRLSTFFFGILKSGQSGAFSKAFSAQKADSASPWYKQD
jgi:hypothetical protein